MNFQIPHDKLKTKKWYYVGFGIEIDKTINVANYFSFYTILHVAI